LLGSADPVDGAVPTDEAEGSVFDDAAVEYEGSVRPFDEVERLYIRTSLVPDFEWLGFDEPSPRTQIRIPLTRARIGLVVTGGVHLPDQRPARLIGEVRLVPIDAPEVRLTHEGYDTERASEDPEVVFPVRTLLRLSGTGSIGSVAPVVPSTMGYIPRGGERPGTGGAPVVASLVPQQVDLALLVPA
jgi:hypothetical protein